MRADIFKNFKWAGYGVIVYAIFSIGFVRLYGSTAYAEFAFLSNTLFPLLLIGSYQSHLIMDESMYDKNKFKKLLKVSSYYNVAISLLIVALFSIAVNLDVYYFVVLFISVFLLLMRNPANAILASSESNWMIAKYRNIYQIIFITLVFAVYSQNISIINAFLIAILVASIMQLSAIHLQAAKIIRLRKNKKNTNNIQLRNRIFFGVLANSFVALGMTLDKYAITLFEIRGEDVNIYLLYQDILIKFSVVYGIFSAPLTFRILKQNKISEKVNSKLINTLLLYIVGVMFMGGVILYVSVYWVPVIYGFELDANSKTPYLVTLWIAFNGFGYITLALCNGMDKNKVLLFQNMIALFIGSMYLIYRYYFAEVVTVYDVLESIIMMQGLQIVTLIYMMVSELNFAGYMKQHVLRF
jgi:hypothetical protein